MADEEYVEPDNEQLARFLVVYARHIPALSELSLNEHILKAQMDRNPKFREGALKHHRQFQEQINEHTRLTMAGKLQCEGRTKKGKRCPNRNEPGSLYCGLHQDDV